MHNQEFDIRENGTLASLKRNGRAMLLAVIVIVMLVVGPGTVLARQASLSFSVETDPAVAAPQVEPFSTQQYWELAKVSAAPVVAPQVEPFSTQQYWDLAKVSAAPVVAPQVEPFSTQQYWDLANGEPEWSFYTERYWSQATR